VTGFKGIRPSDEIRDMTKHISRAMREVIECASGGSNASIVGFSLANPDNPNHPYGFVFGVNLDSLEPEMKTEVIAFMKKLDAYKSNESKSA
jgi:hypothetical protein